MAEHKATIEWKGNGPNFLKGQYSREHTWTFDGGCVVQGSPAPSSVPAPYCNPAFVDPEEAFVAAISSCHMLTYLFLAYRQGFEVTSYRDEAVGVTAKNEKGVPWVKSVMLHPQIVYAGAKQPSSAEEEQLHHLAHEQCYIANSVKTDIQVAAARASTS